jgi:ribose-phosphate pyrophosphokinase
MDGGQDRVSASVIFPLPKHGPLLLHALSWQSAPALAPCEIARFSNGELYLRLGDPVADRVCGLLGSLAPPDEQTLSVLLLAHTLRREGARYVVALLPYLGYARQDRADPGQSWGAAWAGELLRAAGVDRVLTVDVHSRQAVACFPMPLDSLSPAQLFADVLAKSDPSNLTVVAPDEGALDRCEAVRRAAGIHTPLAFLRKQRDAGGVAHSALVGTVLRRAAIVDDILDTGGTLLSACVELRQAGAQEITVFATHGLFTGERWRELPTLGVQRIYTTDSIPSAGERGGDIVEVLPVGGMIVAAFAALVQAQAERAAAAAHAAVPSVVEQIEGPAPGEDSSVP